MKKIWLLPFLVISVQLQAQNKTLTPDEIRIAIAKSITDQTHAVVRVAMHHPSPKQEQNAHKGGIKIPSIGGVAGGSVKE